ncbi:MAG: hypothetical protein ACLPX7_04930 [Xanthobacteraceae bacterium]
MHNLQRKTIAAIAVTLLSLPLMSGAQAKEAKALPAAHKAIYNTTRTPSTMTPKADAAYRNYPTWPEAEPDYHGSNGG